MTVPGNAYPAVQLDSRGEVVDSGVVVQFTDSTDQPGSGGGGSSPVQIATVTLTSEQILSLDTVPVTIVPAPGVGKAIVPLGTFGWVIPGETPYTDEEGSEFLIYEGDGQSLCGVGIDLTVTDPAGAPEGANNGQSAGPFENTAVQIFSAGSITDGDGTAVVSVIYATAPTS